MQVEGCRAYRASGVHVSTSVMLTVTVIAVSGLAGVGGRGALVYNVLSQALSTWRVDDLLCWAVDVHKSSFTLNEALLTYESEDTPRKSQPTSEFDFSSRKVLTLCVCVLATAT